MNFNLKYKPPEDFGKEQKAIWQVLIYNDFVAFCTQDWDLISDDFISDEFFGVAGNGSNNKLDWSLKYPSLESYKEDWISQSTEFNQNIFVDDPLQILFDTTKLSKIEIKGDCALVHKCFSGKFEVQDEEPIILDWISLFLLRKQTTKWRISNFTGYLPK